MLKTPFPEVRDPKPTFLFYVCLGTIYFTTVFADCFLADGNEDGAQESPLFYRSPRVWTVFFSPSPPSKPFPFIAGHIIFYGVFYVYVLYGAFWSVSCLGRLLLIRLIARPDARSASSVSVGIELSETTSLPSTISTTDSQGTKVTSLAEPPLSDPYAILEHHDHTKELTEVIYFAFARAFSLRLYSVFLGLGTYVGLCTLICLIIYGDWTLPSETVWLDVHLLHKPEEIGLSAWFFPFALFGRSTGGAMFSGLCAVLFHALLPFIVIRKCQKYVSERMQEEGDDEERRELLGKKLKLECMPRKRTSKSRSKQALVDSTSPPAPRIVSDKETPPESPVRGMGEFSSISPTKPYEEPLNPRKPRRAHVYYFLLLDLGFHPLPSAKACGRLVFQRKKSRVPRWVSWVWFFYVFVSVVVFLGSKIALLPLSMGPLSFDGEHTKIMLGGEHLAPEGKTKVSDSPVRILNSCQKIVNHFPAFARKCKHYPPGLNQTAPASDRQVVYIMFHGNGGTLAATLSKFFHVNAATLNHLCPGLRSVVFGCDRNRYQLA